MNSLDEVLPALVCLAVGVFAIGTEGLMIAGLLPAIASDLNVTEPTASYLISVFSLTYAVTSPVLAVALARVAQRRLIATAILIFAVGNGLAAVAPNYGMLLLARITLALSAAVFMPAALNAAGQMVTPSMRGTALARLNSGAALAITVGVPLGTLMGQAIGWRFAFAAVAVTSGIAGAILLIRLPDMNTTSVGTLTDRIAAIRRVGVPTGLLTTLLWAMGVNTLYTFIAAFVAETTTIPEAGLSAVLFGIGISSMIGAYLGGKATDRWGAVRVRAGAIGAMCCVYLAIALIGSSHPRVWLATVATPGLLFLCAGLAWMFYSAQQVRLLHLVPPVGGPLVLSLNASFMYLGFAGGATAGALMLQGGSASSLGWISALCELAGLGILILTASRRAIVHGSQGSSEGRA